MDLENELDAANEEAKAWKTIWSAGQGVTSIHDSPSVQNLVSRLKEEFSEAVKKQIELTSRFTD